MNSVAAEILTIGTELLLGEIVDTNTSTIAIAIREIGLDLYRTSTVGDNIERIAMALQDAIQRSPIVLTTGGLGPTVDDVTREGVAQAFNLDLQFHPELWSQIEERFARFGSKPSENNRRQAELPRGATAIENPIGTAPGFMIDQDDITVISMPGVPAEMMDMLAKTVLPYLKRKYQLTGTIQRRILRTAGLGESIIDSKIQDLEKMSNPTVGLSAHPGRVDIRITAKANSEREAEEMIWGYEATLRKRLGDTIYGVDQETLEDCVARQLKEKSWRVCTVEAGTAGLLSAALAAFDELLMSGILLPPHTPPEDLCATLQKEVQEHQVGVGLAVHLAREGPKHNMRICLELEGDLKSIEASYGGPPDTAPQWAISQALNRLRLALG